MADYDNGEDYGNMSDYGNASEMNNGSSFISTDLSKSMADYDNGEDYGNMSDYGNASEMNNGSHYEDEYYYDDYYDDEYWEYLGNAWLFKTLGPLLVIVGTLGNITALLVLLRKTYRKTSPGFILCALAVVDTGMLNTGLLRHCVLNIFHFDMRSESVTSCRLHYYLTYLFSHASPMTVSLMTVERMTSVWFPFRVKQIFTMRNVVCIWGGLFVLLMCYNAHAFVTMDLHFDSYTNTSHCYFSKDEYHDWLHKVVFYWINALLSSFLPSVILFVCNMMIIVKLMRRERTMNSTAVSSRSTTIMLLTVSIVFLLCTVPLSIYLIGTGDQEWWPEETSEDRAKLHFTFAFLSILYYINNAINIFLYCLAGARFRKELKAMLKSLVRPRTALQPQSSHSQSSQERTGIPLKTRVTQRNHDDTIVTTM